jgi:hypothetical protein
MVVVGTKSRSEPRTTVMMGLNDIDAAEILGILVIAILLISFVWRLYIGDRREMGDRHDTRVTNGRDSSSAPSARGSPTWKSSPDALTPP